MSDSNGLATVNCSMRSTLDLRLGRRYRQSPLTWSRLNVKTIAAFAGRQLLVVGIARVWIVDTAILGNVRHSLALALMRVLMLTMTMVRTKLMLMLFDCSMQWKTNAMDLH